MKNASRNHCSNNSVHYVFFDIDSFFKDNISDKVSDNELYNTQPFVMSYLLIAARKDIEKIDSLLKINITNAVNKFNSLDRKDMGDLDEDDEWDF